VGADALIKARPVAGDEKVGEEFIRMVQPFVYARHAGENVIQQMRPEEAH